MNLSVISREDALKYIKGGVGVYIIRPVSLNSEVSLRELLSHDFAIEEPESYRVTDVPEPPKEAGGG